MSFSDYWNALDFTSTTSNLLFTAISTWVGFRGGISSSREQSRRDQLEERESTFKSMEFFVCDCMIAMRDADENLRLRRPPHRALPVAGIEYFQVQAMRHSDHELSVALAALRSQIEQANTLLPVILDRFTIDPMAATDPRNPLRSYCDETSRRYGEVRLACESVTSKIVSARQNRRVKKAMPNQPPAVERPFSDT